METILTSIFKSLPKSAMTPELLIGALIVSLLLLFKKKILPSITKSISEVKKDTVKIDKKILTKEEVSDLIKVNARVDEVINTLNHLVANIESILENGKNTNRDTEILKRDLEQVKGILNQFQGHMLFGRRSSDFENQELR